MYNLLQGMTKAYSKAGHSVAFFKSALPSGTHSSRCITILDCVWNYQNRTYYVLDVLAWNNIVLLDCEVQLSTILNQSLFLCLEWILIDKLTFHLIINLMFALQTEFRFYWLKAKLDEIPEVACHTETNRYAFVAVPYIECKEEYLTELMSNYPMFSESSDPGLDGILFYHKSNLYEHGSTPLVSFLYTIIVPSIFAYSCLFSFIFCND